MTTSRLTTSGWSMAVRKATNAPRSWPTTAKRSCPRWRTRPTTSSAIARLDDWACPGASGGRVERP